MRQSIFIRYWYASYKVHAFLPGYSELFSNSCRLLAVVIAQQLITTFAMGRRSREKASARKGRKLPQKSPGADNDALDDIRIGQILSRVNLAMMSADRYINISEAFKWPEQLSFGLGFWFEYWGSRLRCDPGDLVRSIDELLRGGSGPFYSIAGDSACWFLIDIMFDEYKGKFSYTPCGIGSYYSDTANLAADEFNFLLEPEIDIEGLRFVQSCLRTEASSYSDFFCIYDRNREELKASHWRNTFQQGLIVLLQYRYPNCAVFVNGPTVTVIAESHGSFRFDPPLKINMTLGIPLDIENDDHVWPLERSQVEFDKEKLSPICSIMEKKDKLSRCHFIPCGDLWRLSFAQYEVEAIRSFSREKREFFAGLKVNYIV